MECDCGASMKDKTVIRNGFVVMEYQECSGCGRSKVNHDIAANYANGYLGESENYFDPSIKGDECAMCGKFESWESYNKECMDAALHCTSRDDFVVRVKEIESQNPSCCSDVSFAVTLRR